MIKICLQCGRPGFDHWVGKIPWRMEQLPTPVSGLENAMDCILHEVTKSQTLLNDFHFHFLSCSSSSPAGLHGAPGTS